MTPEERASVERCVEAAFREGFNAPTTYNDKVENNIDEEWARAKPSLLSMVEERASDQAAAAVPPGWVLVPVEPTQEMVYAALTADVDWIGHQGLCEDIYRAMLKAAPPAPLKPEVPVGVWNFEGVPPAGSTCLVWAKPHYAKAPYYMVDNYGEQHEAPVSFSSATIPIGDGWDTWNHEDVIAWCLLNDAGPSTPTPPAENGHE